MSDTDVSFETTEENCSATDAELRIETGDDVIVVQNFSWTIEHPTPSPRGIAYPQPLQDSTAEFDCTLNETAAEQLRSSSGITVNATDGEATYVTADISEMEVFSDYSADGRINHDVTLHSFNFEVHSR